MSVDINIRENKYNLNLNDLIVMGKRINNEKRNFLFISKVLGKHIEAKPSVCKEIGCKLAGLIFNKEEEGEIHYKGETPSEGYIMVTGRGEVELELVSSDGKWCASKELTEEKNIMIHVDNVSMQYKVTTNNVSGLKEYFIQKVKHQISYRTFWALTNIDFDVYQGEIVGIIGTNGSGKSTLLKIISGALKPTGGNVEVDSRKIQLLTLGTGFDMELTARENVYLNGAIIGYTKEFIDEHYESIVEFAELQDFMDEKVKNFSSGMVSRLGFAIATAGDAAEILILDEVLSVGDEFFRKKSLKRIKEMIHSGSTVLMVSHGMGTILENCTKVVWIEKGELKMVGEPKKVCEAYRKMNDKKN